MTNYINTNGHVSNFDENCWIVKQFKKGKSVNQVEDALMKHTKSYICEKAEEAGITGLCLTIHSKNEMVSIMDSDLRTIQYMIWSDIEEENRREAEENPRIKELAELIKNSKVKTVLDELKNLKKDTLLKLVNGIFETTFRTKKSAIEYLSSLADQEIAEETKDSTWDDPYFKDQASKIIFYLIEAGGEMRMNVLGISLLHYSKREVAKRWRDNLLKIVHPDVCNHPYAAKATAEVNRIYENMTKY